MLAYKETCDRPTKTMRVLAICHNPELSLVVLKALKANGIRPLLICGENAYATLSASRLISEIVLTTDLNKDRESVAEAINAAHRDRPIDIVLASDVVGLRLLCELRERLLPPLYPMPERAMLDLLDDKWRFYRLAKELGITTPQTLYFADRREISPAHVGREIGFPAVVKPVSAWAALGFLTVASELELGALVEDANYGFESVIVQRYIPGRDIGLGLFARHGETLALSTFFCGRRDAAEFAELPDFALAGRKIARATDYNGVANFDARLDADGKVWLLECNPRFFMRLSAARACGLDFLRLGLSSGAAQNIPEAKGRYYSLGDLGSAQGLGFILSGQWPLRMLLRSLRDALADPAPVVIKRFGRKKA